MKVNLSEKERTKAQLVESFWHLSLNEIEAEKGKKNVWGNLIISVGI